MCTQTIDPKKLPQTLFLKDVKLAECLVVSSHVPTQKQEQEASVCLFHKAAERDDLGYISV